MSSPYGFGFKWASRRKTNPKRKRIVQPNQALSIQTIIERFTRNIPVNVHRPEPVYSEQSEFDLEKLSRMSFAEKKEFADEMGRRAIKLETELKEDERAKQEARTKKAQEAAEKALAAMKANSAGGQQPPAGIVTP